VLELQYADDCALVSHTTEGLQTTLNAAVRAYSRMGLDVNLKKTEVLCQWSWTLDPLQKPPAFTIHDSLLVTVPHSKYLGSYLSNDCIMDQDIQHRIKQAAASFGRLRKRVFFNTNLHLHTKIPVYRDLPPSCMVVKHGPSRLDM